MAAFFVDELDAADAPHADLGPDVEGEGPPDEPCIQLVTLSPERRPFRRAMRTAYFRNGDLTPSNL